VSDVEQEDPLNEERHRIAGTSIIHRYPKRVLFLVQNTCAAYCRFCTRKRMVSGEDDYISKGQLMVSLEYLQKHTEINDVLLSGGDPLLMSDKVLECLFKEIRSLPHIKILRISSRMPVQNPYRLTPALCKLLRDYNVLLNIHVNHPKEITPIFIAGVNNLRDAGVTLGSQTVILKGINDKASILESLFMELVSIGVRPYYAYTCDRELGNSHFEVNLQDSQILVRQLRGYISGVAMPTFVVDGEGGLGKIPLEPSGFKIKDIGVNTLTNYKGESRDVPA